MPETVPDWAAESTPSSAIPDWAEQPSSSVSGTTETEKAAAQSGSIWDSVINAARAPSPAWMQPIEKGIRDVATYQIPGVAEANPIYWMGRYNQAIAPYLPKPFDTISNVSGALGVGTAKGVASMATPMNAGLALLNPPSAVGRAALAGIFTAQAAANTPQMIDQIKKDYQAGDVGALTEHTGELAASYLPVAHFLGPRGKGPVEPGTRVKETELPTPGGPGQQQEEEPVILHDAAYYKFNPGADSWEQVTPKGARITDVSPKETDLIEALNEKANVLDAERAKAPKTPEEPAAPETTPGETDDEAEQRATNLMEKYRNLAGEPEAVMLDMTQQNGGVPPTWGEYADELQGEVDKLTATPELALRAYSEGIAKRRGVPVSQVEAEFARRENEGRLRTIGGITDATLSRREFEQERNLKPKGGRYAKQPGYAQVEGGNAPLRGPGRPSGEVSTAGNRYNVVGETQGEGTRGRVSGEEPVPATQALVSKVPGAAEAGLEQELRNRAKENVRKKLELPKDPVELLKRQEDGLAPSNAELQKLEQAEYDRLRGQRAPPGRPHVPAASEPVTGARPADIEEANRKIIEGLEAGPDLGTIAGRIEAGVPEPKPARAPVDEFANSPETPVATAVSEMGGIQSKSAAQKAGTLKGNEALYDDAPKLKHPSHNKIYKTSGEKPDVMAQNLHDAGLIKEPTTDAMYRALEKESASVRAKGKGGPEEGTKARVKQAENFGKGQRQEIESGTKAVPARELSVGDSVKVDGTPLKVVSADAEGITLEDGRRFGRQEVHPDDVIYGEKKGPSPKEKNMPEWVRERMIQEGKDPNRPLNEQDIQNPSVREAIEADPTLSRGEKDNLLKTGQKTPLAEQPPKKFSTRTNFKRVSEGRYTHKNGEVLIDRNFKSGGWDIRDGKTGEVIDNKASRQAAMEDYADGKPASIAAEGKKLRLKANNEGGFINPEIFKEAVDFGKRLLSRGYNYGKWATEMVKNLGQKVAGRLKEIWENLTGGKLRSGFKESGEVGRTGGRYSGRGYGKAATTPGKYTGKGFGKAPATPERRFVKGVGWVLNAPRRMVLTGHFAAFTKSHLADQLYYNPKTYFRNFVNSWRLLTKGGREAHAARVRELINPRDPEVQEAEKYGLNVGEGGKGKFAQETKEVTGIRRIFKGPDRVAMAYDELRISRMQIWRKEVARLDAATRADPEQMRDLAAVINRDTGTTIRIPGFRWLFISPRLFPAQFGHTFYDIPRALYHTGFGLNYRNATPAMQYVARKVAILAGVQAAMLAANYGIGKAVGAVAGQKTGEKFTPNFGQQGDTWAEGIKKTTLGRIKIGGYTIPTSPTIELMKLPFQMIAAGAAARKGENAPLAALTRGLRTILGRQNPAFDYMWEALFGQDVGTGQPTPFRGIFRETPETRTAHRQAWPEYAGTKMPIPLHNFTKAFFDNLVSGGMSKDDAMKWVKILAIPAVEGLTSYSIEPERETPFPASHSAMRGYTPMKHR